MLPDFIGIGPARSATTWMYESLKSHPEICMARWDKKTHFFDLYFEKGSDWYEDFYSRCEPGKKRGELTETYIFYDEIPQRIHALCPHVKIFSCLRNPVDRAFSAYNHLVRDGVLTCSFEQALQEQEKILITDSMYYDHLRPYFSLFPKEQLHITLFEDVLADQKKYLFDLYSFLGVDPGYLPPDHGEKKNRTEQPRFPLLNKVMLISHLILRDLHLYRFLIPLKESRLVQKLRFKEQKGRPVMKEETRQQLQRVFRPQIEQLGELLERDVSIWLS